jgi:hypothetical protein
MREKAKPVEITMSRKSSLSQLVDRLFASIDNDTFILADGDIDVERSSGTYNKLLEAIQKHPLSARLKLAKPRVADPSAGIRAAVADILGGDGDDEPSKALLNELEHLLLSLVGDQETFVAICALEAIDTRFDEYPLAMFKKMKALCKAHPNDAVMVTLDAITPYDQEDDEVDLKELAQQFAPWRAQTVYDLVQQGHEQARPALVAAVKACAAALATKPKAGKRALNVLSDASWQPMLPLIQLAIANMPDHRMVPALQSLARWSSAQTGTADTKLAELIARCKTPTDASTDQTAMVDRLLDGIATAWRDDGRTIHDTARAFECAPVSSLREACQVHPRDVLVPKAAIYAADRDPNKRCAAAIALSYIAEDAAEAEPAALKREAKALDVLLSLCDDRDETVTLTAFEALRLSVRRPFADAVMTRLQRFELHADERVRRAYAALFGVPYYGDNAWGMTSVLAENEVDVWLRLLANPMQPVRQEAAQHLWTRADEFNHPKARAKKVRAALHGALIDLSFNVRSYALMALMGLGEKGLSPLILQELEQLAASARNMVADELSDTIESLETLIRETPTLAYSEPLGVIAKELKAKSGHDAESHALLLKLIRQCKAKKAKAA